MPPIGDINMGLDLPLNGEDTVLFPGGGWLNPDGTPSPCIEDPLGGGASPPHDGIRSVPLVLTVSLFFSIPAAHFEIGSCSCSLP